MQNLFAEMQAIISSISSTKKPTNSTPLKGHQGQAVSNNNKNPSYENLGNKVSLMRGAKPTETRETKPTESTDQSKPKSYEGVEELSRNTNIPEIEKVAKYFGITDPDAFRILIDGSGKEVKRENYVSPENEVDGTKSLPKDLQEKLQEIKGRIKLTEDEEKAIGALFQYRKDRGLDKFPHDKTSYEDYLVLKVHGMSQKRINEFFLQWEHDQGNYGTIDPKALEVAKDPGVKALLLYRKWNNLDPKDTKISKQEDSLMRIAYENARYFNIDYSKLMTAEPHLRMLYDPNAR